MQRPSAAPLFALIFLAVSPAFGVGEDDQRPAERKKPSVNLDECHDTYGDDSLTAEQCVQLSGGTAPQKVTETNPNTGNTDNQRRPGSSGRTQVVSNSDSTNNPSGNTGDGGVGNPNPNKPIPVNPQIIAETREQERPALDSGKTDQITNVAQNYLRGGSTKDADRVVTQALNANPNDPSLLSMRARTRALAGDNEGAVADARRVLKIKPDDEIAHFIVGNRDQLAASAKKLLNAKPNLSELQPQDLPNSAVERLVARNAEPAQYASIGLPMAAGAAGGAAPNVAALYTKIPLPPHARTLVDSARAKAGLGDLSGAFMDATRAIDLAPGSAAPLVLRAHINNRLQQPDGAVSDAGKALVIEPQNAAALRERAYGNIQLGLYKEALADLEQALRLEPESATGYFYRAMAEEKLGQRAAALADYERAAKFDPGLKAALNDAMARLGATSALGLPSGAGNKKFFRAGAVVASVFLLLMGLAGSRAGKRAVTTARGYFSSSEAATLLPAPELTPGSFVGSSMRVVRELGRGGMGIVYEGFDETLQRRVAIKRLQRDASTTTDDLSRFILEARTVARLRHPRLAEIYSVLEDADVYLVFEYVEGESLDRVLGRRQLLSLTETRRAMSDVASAVGYAHDQRVIHKDLKPANVVLEPSGGSKVMDFGIAHHAATSATKLTRTFASGTPPYMSPEQAMGSVSKASDIYAMGVMTYELLCGRRPFQGPDFLEQKLNGQFPPISSLNPDLPSSLDPFFRTALHPDPTKRPKSAHEFISFLDQASA